MTEYSKKLIKGTTIVLIFSVVSALMGYLLKFLLAQKLEVNEIGLFFSVLGFVSFFVFFRDLGLADSLVFFIPRFLIEKSSKKIKSSILFTLFVQLGISLFFFIIMLFFSTYLSKNYFKDPRADMLLLFLCIYFIIDGIHEVLLKSFQGFQKIFFQQALDFSFQFFSFVLLVLIIYSNKNIIFFGAAYVIADLLSVIIFYFIFVKKVFVGFIGVKIKIDKRLRKKLLGYALPMMSWTVAEVGFAQQTIFFLTLFAGLESVGYYVMIRAIAKLSIFLYKASSRVFTPMISELWKKKRFGELNFLFKEQLIFIYIFALPVIFGIFVFSDIILRLLYGEKFVIASFALKIAALYFLFDIINTNLNNFSQSTGFPQIPRNNAYLKFLINMLSNLLLIPFFGLLGAVFADLISIIVAAMHAFYFTIRKIKISFPARELSFLLFSSFFYILSVFLLRFLLKSASLNIYLMLGIILIISGAIYLFFIIFFKIINLKQINKLIKKSTNDKIDFSFLNRDYFG